MESSRFFEVLKHGQLRDADEWTLAWLIAASFIALYLLYSLVVGCLYDWTTVSVSLSLRVRRGSSPLCARCAGASLRTSWQTLDFSADVPNGQPVRVRFVNDFRIDDDNDKPRNVVGPPASDDGAAAGASLSSVNRLAIHDCGGIEEVYLEMACSRGPVELLCLPSEDYPNILLQEEESFFVPSGSTLSFFFPHALCTTYVTWGRLMLGENCSRPPPVSRKESVLVPPNWNRKLFRRRKQRGELDRKSGGNFMWRQWKGDRRRTSMDYHLHSSPPPPTTTTMRIDESSPSDDESIASSILKTIRGICHGGHPL